MFSVFSGEGLPPGLLAGIAVRISRGGSRPRRLAICPSHMVSGGAELQSFPQSRRPPGFLCPLPSSQPPVPTQLTWGRPVFCLQCAWTQKRKRPVVQPRAHPAVPECMSLQQSRAQCSARERPAPGSLSVSRGEVHLGRGPSPPLHYEVAVSVLQASRFKISHRGLGTKRILFQDVCDAVPSLEIQSLSYRSKGLTSGRLTRRVFTVLLLMSPVARTAVLGGGRLLSCPAAPQAGAELGCGPQGESAGLSGIPPGTCASREGDPSALAQALWAVAGLLCGPYSS